MDEERRSNYEHCSNILLEAERLGFQNILLPTSYIVGQDALAFASAIAPSTSRINLLVATRCGEIHPPMLARAISTLDHILKGRLTINIINSDLPGYKEEGALRYARCAEVIEILKQSWNEKRIDIDGSIYKLNLPSDSGQALSAKRRAAALLWRNLSGGPRGLRQALRYFF
ncbi:MAG: LLM class flavin-dependent oxidoreductase [Pyrinomonadaceae bacterium]